MAVDKFVPKPKKETNKGDEKDDGDEDASERKPEKPEDKTCDWTARLRAVRTTTCRLIDSRVQKVSEAVSDQLLLSGLSHSKLPLMWPKIRHEALIVGHGLSLENIYGILEVFKMTPADHDKPLSETF